MRTQKYEGLEVRHSDAGNLVDIKIARPSNFHAHYRRGPLMKAVAPSQMAWVKHSIIMPNTGPIRTIDEALLYRQELLSIAETYGYTKFNPLMTLYFTEYATPDTVEVVAKSRDKHRIVHAFKYYPVHKGATTGSGYGMDLFSLRAHETLRAMEDCKVPLLGHFESVTDENNRELPHKEREEYFIDHYIRPLLDKYPRLHVCFEHGSTAKLAQLMQERRDRRLATTITPQHLLFTKEAFERYTWRNHLKCMPIVKTADDRDALVELVTSGEWRVILGDDTAPHLSRMKTTRFDECANGCFTPHSLALYAKAFAKADALDERFVDFTSFNGPDWWDLPRPEKEDFVTLRATSICEDDIPQPVEVPEENDVVIPLGWSTDDPYCVGIRIES